MRLRGSQQVEPISFRLAERLLVTEDDLMVVVLHLTKGDEPAPLGDRTGSVAGNLESLSVEIKAGRRVGHQNAFCPPLPQRSSGAGIDILLVIITSLRLAEDDAHQVVRTGRVVLVLHCRGDLIVRLGYDLGG